MKLAYNIPGKLWWIQEFLPPLFYRDLHDAIIKQRKKIKLHSAKGVWPDSLITNIEAPHLSEVKNYKPFDELKILVKHNPFFRIECKKMLTIIHSMKKGAGINWHPDTNWKYGASYYINRRWNHQWGGEFMFKDKNSHGYIPLIGNSLVIVKTPFHHKVNQVLSPTMPRMSIQIFMR
tara:strand:+ start:169 stop:699 length:531 start_codon:yes stop_codon:yes gene_type:complete